jgi:large subunit ribosomal protein L22
MNKIAIAKTRYIRISPRKMVGVCKLVRGKEVLVARAILMQTAKKGARIIEKTLNSAVANAKNKNMDAKNLLITKIAADIGPSMKRYIPGAKGGPSPIKRRMTHLTIILEERAGGKKVIKQEIKEVKEDAKKQVVKEKKSAKPKVTVKKKDK